MNKLTIVGVAIIIILIISLALAWIMTSSEPTDETEKLDEIVEEIRPHIPISVPKPPPPPNVYWSEFNKTILNLEQEHVAILQVINPLNIKQTQPKIPVTQQMLPTKKLNWSNITANLLELEQLRKDIIGSLQADDAMR